MDNASNSGAAVSLGSAGQPRTLNRIIATEPPALTINTLN